MAKPKNSASARGRQVARSLAVLRRKGLIGAKEYRGKPGGGAYKLIRKYRDVIEGRATVVKPKTRLIPKQIKTAFKERRGRLVVPKVEGTVATTVERVKTGKHQYTTKIMRSRRVPGRGIIREQVLDVSRDLPELKLGQVYRITMPNWQSAKFAFSEQELNDYIGKSSNLRIWADITVIDRDQLDEIYGDDDDGGDL